MKDENQAWRMLEQKAADQLRGDFAGRVLRAGRGPSDAAWRELYEVGGDQLRLGFADRVLRAVRARIVRPSFHGQLALGAATLATLIISVVIFHERTTRSQNERNIASWEQLANESQYFGLRQ
jgi:hypothetical protein